MVRRPPTFFPPPQKTLDNRLSPPIFRVKPTPQGVYNLASLYILVFQACHLWPHSTCPLLDTPLVFHNHNLHPAPRSCCHSTNHCYELVIRYRILYQLCSGADIENLCREVRDVNYVHCQRIRGAIGVIVLNT